jgi:hypothetical protein
VPTFRYYLLDRNGSIIGAEYLESPDLNAAIVEVYVSWKNLGTDRVHRFEIWQESTLLHEGICETTANWSG